MRRLVWLPLLAACGANEPIGSEDLAIRVVLEGREVEFGRAFPLTVRRTWRKPLVPSEWQERSLAPLALEPVGRERREKGDRVEETFRYRARAFRLGEVRLAGASMSARPREGGPERTAAAPAASLTVRSSLPPGDGGLPEFPGAPDTGGRAWLLVGALGVAIAGALLAVRRLARRRRPPPGAESAVPPPPDPRGRALRALAGIRDTPGGDPALDLARAAGILRGYLAEGLALPAATMTSAEIFASAALPSAARPHLAEALALADLAKFAGHRPSPAERERFFDRAESFLGEASGARGSERGGG